MTQSRPTAISFKPFPWTLWPQRQQLMPTKKPSFSAPKTQASQTKAGYQGSLPNFVVGSLREELRSWYAQMGRDLPWRQTGDPTSPILPVVSLAKILSRI